MVALPAGRRATQPVRGGLQIPLRRRLPHRPGAPPTMPALPGGSCSGVMAATPRKCSSACDARQSALQQPARRPDAPACCPAPRWCPTTTWATPTPGRCSCPCGPSAWTSWACLAHRCAAAGAHRRSWLLGSSAVCGRARSGGRLAWPVKHGEACAACRCPTRPWSSSASANSPPTSAWGRASWTAAPCGPTTWVRGAARCSHKHRAHQSAGTALARCGIHTRLAHLPGRCSQSRLVAAPSDLGTPGPSRHHRPGSHCWPLPACRHARPLQTPAWPPWPSCSRWASLTSACRAA